MNQVPTILIVDDDEGHAILIRQNLESAGLANRMEHFRDGQAILDFFWGRDGAAPTRHEGCYLILLDVRMPKVDGVEVLRRLKSDAELKKLPVIMLTTTDDTREIERCYALGCNEYIRKPVEYEKFAEAIRRLGLFLTLLVVTPVRPPE
jgi:CheY-like chemotaxis protein